MSKILIRFDDVSPGMAWSKFVPLKEHLEGLGIRAVLGVVPDCQDKALSVEEIKPDFYDLIRRYRDYGDIIAQHGTHHNYVTQESGILGINNFSEFAGLSLEEQKLILKKGKEILLAEDVWQPYFMAPAHSFDTNTLRALRDLDFHALTDGYGFYPYVKENIVLVPQLTSFYLPISLGIQTICIHINAMSESGIQSIISFLHKNYKKFISFEEAIEIRTSSSIIASSLRIFSKQILRVKRKRFNDK